MNITEVIQENQRTSTSQVDNADAAGAAIQRQHDYMKNQAVWELELSMAVTVVTSLYFWRVSKRFSNLGQLPHGKLI